MNFPLTIGHQYSASGFVSVFGAKNAILPLLMSTLIVNDKTVFRNAPTEILDFGFICDFIRDLGVEVTVGADRVTVVNSGNLRISTRADLAAKSRYSILSAGCLAGRYGEAKIHLPGGCKFQEDRPIDIHLSGLSHLGCKITEDGDTLQITSTAGRETRKFSLPYPSVGATLNLVFYLIAAGKGGLLKNCAIEPEICDVLRFLTACGARIAGIGTRKLEIAPSDGLTGTEWTVIGDRIEAGTYALLAVLRRKNVTIGPIEKSYLQATIDLIDQMKVPTHYDHASKQFSVLAANVKAFGTIDITTGVYPGFPTDLQPLAVATSLALPGRSRIRETVSVGRFGFVSELRKLGAKIQVIDNTAKVNPSNALRPAILKCPDIRGGMACIFGASLAGDLCRISDFNQVRRGYQRVQEALSVFAISIQEHP